MDLSTTKVLLISLHLKTKRDVYTMAFLHTICLTHWICCRRKPGTIYPYFAELVLLALFLNKFPNFSYIFCDQENMTLGTYILINPNSDQHQFSLNDVHCLERDKVMTMNKTISWEKCFDLLSNSLNTFFKEMYRDQFGEFVFDWLGLKGLSICLQYLLTFP